jgi:cobalt-zinc-cadmium efflux system protein
MTHEHCHRPTNFDRAFAIGVGLNLSFVVAQVVFGLLANSLALLADAGHNLSDVFGLMLAWGASYLARQSPTPRRTYGLRRSSILAALLNSVLLLVVTGAIAWEGIRRLFHPDPVSGTAVIAVAAVGVVINSATALLFMSGQHDLNIRGAFLHMAADAAISLGVVVAGVVIALTGWLWVDPVVSLALAAAIAAGNWGLLRQSIDMSMDAVPQGVDLEGVRDYLAGLPGVTAFHDLHIWGMSTTETALTVHLMKPEGLVDDDWLAEISQQLHDRFHIEHATIQVESGRATLPCRLEPEDTV